MGVVAMLQVPGCGVTPFEAAPGNPAVAKAGGATPGAGAFEQCLQHFPGFVPAVAWPGQQRALCFEGYAVLHSGQSKTPVYSVERLTQASVAAAKGVKRVDHFYPEARLPSADRAQLADYSGSGYDRGHMAPAGDMATDAAKAQSFSLANMVPQAPELNQRDWNQIEQATRKYAARAGDDVFVFTGPAFSQRPSTVGPGKVWVPSHTWKVVYARGERRVWAYWMENSAGKHSPKPISYQEFTQRSGIRLLPDSQG
ncbi:DNA/RNA non-specific endonuclease [Xylophilus rhododendri]|uniref:Endonuclease n=2 Tax=Xylophilus rhododendri TaxID=2697032 RepID=A0A857JC22_9BURK|nr:DNA/RNA non-specific endonuclease [Xylophilus rhododendri]